MHLHRGAGQPNMTKTSLARLRAAFFRHRAEQYSFRELLDSNLCSPASVKPQILLSDGPPVGREVSRSFDAPR